MPIHIVFTFCAPILSWTHPYHAFVTRSPLNFSRLSMEWSTCFQIILLYSVEPDLPLATSPSAGSSSSPEALNILEVLFYLHSLPRSIFMASIPSKCLWITNYIFMFYLFPKFQIHKANQHFHLDVWWAYCYKFLCPNLLHLQDSYLINGDSKILAEAEKSRVILDSFLSLTWYLIHQQTFKNISRIPHFSQPPLLAP